MFIWDFLLGDVMDQIIDWFYGSGISGLTANIIEGLNNIGDVSNIGSSGMFGGLNMITSPFMGLFIVILMGYVIISHF